MTALQTARMPEFLRPGDDEYEAAARTFFATGQPALVVRPRGPDEIAAALTHAARHDLRVSVRSGGHSPLPVRAQPQRRTGLAERSDLTSREFRYFAPYCWAR